MDADARIKYRTINNSIDFPWISIMNQNNKDLEDDGDIYGMPWVVFEDIVDGATNAILDELRPAHSCSWTLSLAQIRSIWGIRIPSVLEAEVINTDIGLLWTPWCHDVFFVDHQWGDSFRWLWFYFSYRFPGKNLQVELNAELDL